jgi:nitrogen fixation protein NifX
MTSPSVRRLRLVDPEAAGADSAAAKPGAGTMKVAIATQDLKTVDAHFAGARTIVIYEVSTEGSRMLEAIRFDQISGEDGVHDDQDDRIGPRLDAIRGCQLLFVRAIGGPAAARVVNARVHPIKVTSDEPIGDVLGRCQAMLKGNPPPWLRKVLQAGGAAELTGAPTLTGAPG